MKDQNASIHLPRPAEAIVARARQLRQTATSAEALLWQLLRGKQLNGIKFRRQHPIGTFIADFYCDEARLVVEIDGAIHQERSQQERDALREQILNDYALHVLRFSNEEVFEHPEHVLESLHNFVLSHSRQRQPNLEATTKLATKNHAIKEKPLNNHSPLPQRGGGAGGGGSLPIPPRSMNHD